MLSRLHGSAWSEGNGVGDDDSASKWTESANAEERDELGLPSFKAMLDDDWFLGATAGGGGSSHEGFEALRGLSDVKEMSFSSASDFSRSDSICGSGSSVFCVDPSQALFGSKNSMNSLLNPFDDGFDLGCDAPGLYSVARAASSPVLAHRGAGGEDAGIAGADSNGQMGMPNSTSSGQFLGAHLLPSGGNCSPSAAGTGFDAGDFESVENSMFVNRAKVLRPLDIFPSVGAPPTLFQKRAAALRRNSSVGREKGMSSGRLCLGEGIQGSRRIGSLEVGMENRRRGSEMDELLENGSFDGSGLNYDSEDTSQENGREEGDEKNGNDVGEGGGPSNSNVSSAVTGGRDAKGKRKGPPAKNLMAERRRRKKLNDRLYMLRSVVPKISKMDRASILGDAIEYLKELLQRINDLQNELDSAPSSSSQPAPTAISFHPLTPKLPTLPSRIKDELCPSSFPSPNSQPTRVEVRVREGRAVNIHMFCTRRPGLLLSMMRALDNLGLDIQQAVISCFNGFALDVFRAEQCKDGPGPVPDDIKAVLLQSAGFPNPM